MTDRQTSIAILRAYLAWQRTQPQLTIDGWADMLDGLDQAQPGALGLIASAPCWACYGTGEGYNQRCHYCQGSGLDEADTGAVGLVESAPVVSPSGRTHFENDGTGAPACRLARPCQKGA